MKKAKPTAEVGPQLSVYLKYIWLQLDCNCSAMNKHNGVNREQEIAQLWLSDSQELR